MPRTVSPLQVGTFVLVALFLALGMILFFSTTTLFSSTQTYILYFEDSVKGLSVGSSVKFKGVPIGQVKKIYISYNQSTTSARIPVLIQIESEQLSQLANLRKVNVNDVIQHEIDNGLRAQFQVESFITGMLFIDLNYYPNAGTPQYCQLNKVYREIPTLRGPFSDLGNSANDLVARLNAVDYAGLANSIKNLANTLNGSINSLDMPKLSTALSESIHSLSSILVKADEKDLGRNLGELAENLNKATATGGDLRLAAKNFSDLSAELKNALRGDTVSGVKLHRLVEGLAEASEAFSRLADVLEQNPNALLTGKQVTE